MLPPALGPVVLPPTGLGSDFLFDLWEAATAVIAPAAVLAAWYRRHCRQIYDALVCASVDDVAVEEVLDEVPVLLHLFGPVAIVHNVVADVMHPHVEVGAGVSLRRLPCVEVLVVTEPWKPMVSATASDPTPFHLQNGAAYSISASSGICPGGAPQHDPSSLARRRQGILCCNE